MSQPASSTLIARRDQMFPTVDAADIDRSAASDEACYAAGAHIVTTGSVAPGLIVVISGNVEITWESGVGRRARRS